MTNGAVGGSHIHDTPQRTSFWVHLLILVNFNQESRKWVVTNSSINSSNSELNIDGEMMQIQTSGNRQSAVSSRRSSAGSMVVSRSSSPSPCLGLVMDPARFSLGPDAVTDKPRRRFTKDNFTSKTKGTSLELTQEKSDDPLSQLDPLWPLKRL